MANVEEKKTNYNIKRLESVVSDLDTATEKLEKLRKVLLTMIEDRFYHIAMTELVKGLIYELETQKRHVDDSIKGLEKDFNQIRQINEVIDK